MADTRYLTTVVEQEIRGHLAAQYGMPFHKAALELSPGGQHEFDAVSVDGQIVASIKSASVRTASGKNPAGKIKDCIAELYFLSLVEAPRRILILTSKDMFDVFQRAMRNKVAAGVEVQHLPLTDAVQEGAARVQKLASDEVFPVLDAGEQRATDEPAAKS